MTCLRHSFEKLPKERSHMKPLLLALTLAIAVFRTAVANGGTGIGAASWYGEDHRGRLMANGKKFDPDRLTAASWFYPLGSTVRVTLQNRGKETKTVIVRITDRGPSMDLVREGRIIDLTRTAFMRLAAPHHGLVAVKVEPVRTQTRTN